MESEKLLFPRPPFFPGSRLNFAENLLYPASSPDEDAVAVISATELDREYVSWKQLRERVRQCANALKEAGVQSGDRIAGFLGNHVNAIVAMLAAASLGAFWTGVSPDTGVHAVLERLRQIEPKILFADNASLYNGKVHGAQAKVQQIVPELQNLELLVVFETVKSHQINLAELKPVQGQVYNYDAFLSTSRNPSSPLNLQAWNQITQCTSCTPRARQVLQSLLSTVPSEHCCSTRKSMFCTVIFVPVIDCFILRRPLG